MLCPSPATRTFTVSSEVIEEAIAASSEPNALDVEGRNGWIKLHADPEAPTIEVHAEFKGRARDEVEAQRRADLMDVELDWNEDGSLEVRPVIRATGKEGEWKNGEGVNFTIVVPSIESAKLVSSNGAVEAAGVHGTCTVVTSNGTVDLNDCAGDVSVTTSNATVTAEDIAGDLRVRTSNGRVLVGSQVGSVDVETSNGAISVSLEDGNERAFHLRTSNASVDVDVPPGWSGGVTAKTSNGRVRTSGSGPALSLEDEASFELGTGGSRSTVVTTNGSITIHRR